MLDGANRLDGGGTTLNGRTCFPMGLVAERSGVRVLAVVVDASLIGFNKDIDGEVRRVGRYNPRAMDCDLYHY
jgi:hypothetical protein